MDPYTLKHNPELIRKNFKVVGDKLVAKVPCTVYFPSMFVERNFAMIGAEVNVMGYLIVIIGQEYAVTLTPGFMRLSPDEVNTVDVNEESCYQLKFEAGSVFLANRSIVKNNDYLFDVYDVFVAKGKIPWYLKLKYHFILDIFLFDHHFTGTTLGHNRNVLHMVLTSIVRDKNDPAVFYRQVKKKTEHGFVTIPFRNVGYTATNTVTRLIGSYMDDGINASLTNPTTRVEAVEALLRS